LLKAVRVRFDAISETLVKPLKWLLLKFGEGVVSAVIGLAIAALAALFGISL
jgi:hypothetical protein